MFDCLLLMAGSGTRTSLKYNKIKFMIKGKPIYQYSLEKFLSIKECNKIILVVKKEEYNDFTHLQNEKIKVVIGGETRFESVYNGAMEAKENIVLIHDAARPNIKINNILDVYYKTLESKCACLGVKVKDCIRDVKESSYTLERSTLWQIQTPQGVERNLLIKGLENKHFTNYYDDCEVLEKNFGIKCEIVNGDYTNIKATTDEDLEYLEFLMNKNNLLYKIGHSQDTHRLVKGRKLILGGVDIPFELGLLGHSDADVVYHAVVESVIGALGKGDIGKFFPDNNPKYKDMDSSYFMNEIFKVMDEEGYKVNNIDVSIYIEKPILKDYKPLMEKNIAKLLNTDVNNVNVKATRGEGLGYIGNMEGITAECVCLLVSK